MAAHVIYRGPVEREPETINLPVAGGYLPGTVVLSDGSTFTQVVDPFGRLLLLSNRRMYTQCDVDAYQAEEMAIAYRLEVEQEYRVQCTAGTYVHGDALTVTTSGRFTAAVAGDKVIAYYDGPGETFTGATRADIVIANAHIAA